MEMPRLGKSVVRVIQLEKDANGKVAPHVMYKKAGRKKKMSAPLRPIEKAVRRLASAQAASADKYLDLHQRSNRKNKDGWVRDIFGNLLDAEKRGRKKLRIKRLVMI